MTEEKLASRQFNKVLEVCPFCKNREPKELVELPTQSITTREFNTAAYIVVGLITCGLGFLAFPLFKLPITKKTGGGIAVYCSNCKNSFPQSR